jgi:hypothetical protein
MMEETGGVLKSRWKMPEQRSRFWILIVIMIVYGIPCLANATPKADFSYVPRAGLEIYFDGSLSSDPAGIARYAWTFGDNTPYIYSSVPIAYHVYPDYGTYNVTLQVTSKENFPNPLTTETAYITKQLNITWEMEYVCTPPPCTPGSYTCPPGSYADCPGGCDTQCGSGTLQPYTDFTYRPLGANVVLYDASISYSPDGIAEYSWNFGDRTNVTSSTEPLITHAYSDDGTYWVTLSVETKAVHPASFYITKMVEFRRYDCTAPACAPPGVLTCPTLGCPGDCGVKCVMTETPLGIGPVVVALAGVIMLHLRRRREGK